MALLFPGRAKPWFSSSKNRSIKGQEWVSELSCETLPEASHHRVIVNKLVPKICCYRRVSLVLIFLALY